MNTKKSPFLARISRELEQIILWFSPGLGVKRWFLLVFFGTTMLAVGMAFILLDIYRQAPDNWVSSLLAIISLQFLPRLLRAIIFGGIGVSLVVIGMYRLNHSLLRPFLQPGKPVVKSLVQFNRLERGPQVVVIGGGHGLSTLLRGLKKFTRNLTAIVTVADDGGSSGMLRDAKGMLPPGDIRNCLAALSSDEDLISQLFQYRFSSGDEKNLEGHSFGNLLISALSEITGSFESAIVEAGRALSVYGQVVPSTLNDVRLVADKSLPHMRREVRVRGESQIPEVSGTVRRLWLEPNNPPAYPVAVRALLQADLIVIGPGSLYTSILPNLLVPDITAAVRSSRALKVYICNVSTQPGETDNYSCGDHIRAIEEHVGERLTDLVVSNCNTDPELPEGIQWVEAHPDLDEEYAVYRADLLDGESPYRHDQDKLAQVLIDLFMERTGPLVM
ncbi:MAG TPA: uridine diphosphate-N-acetylglucosamine-binding protein YvcK [Anaerolineales bacterium]|nr:uridine diphosphate-N-acetylglucosamine-binding protein YvcK [Anaerolineales bacterium]